MLAGLELEEAARRAELPALLVYGELDRIVPIEQGEALSRWMPHAKLVRLPGETHLSTPMAPAAVAALVRAFAGKRERHD
jgi:pimeloyl-ACP methyl ester carboxylesterase